MPLNSTASIYVRTTVGRSVAFRPDASMPLERKALLKSVDGLTRLGALVAQFPDHDVADGLRQLQVAGLIKLREGYVPDVQDSTPSVEPENVPAFGPLPSSFFSGGALPPLKPPGRVPAQARTVPSVGRITDVMATFVLTHTPLNALFVLPKLETLQTLEELEAVIPLYATLATASGQAGVEHLAELTERLSEAAAA